MKGTELDLDCLERIRLGDTRALEELYDRYTPLLYPMALRILRSGADAEDALQEAWLQIWNRAASFNPARGSVAAWLVTVARSRALDKYRSLSSRRNAESKAEPDSVAPTVDPTTSASQTQIGARVRAALSELTPQQRQVLEIAYFEGLSQSEIASRLNTPLGTVKSWTRQGMLRLRELLPLEEWV